jgi:glycosyltransferase involved in cell wall biosynthesis
MDFVSFSLDFWEDMWQSRHQIMLWLARNHKVLFVSRPFSLTEVLSNLREKVLPKSGLTHRGNNLYTLVYPKWLCEIYRFPLIDRILAYLRAVQVRRMVKKLELQDTVLFIWNPQFKEMIGTIGESVLCYYADDEFASYAGQTEEQRQRIREREEELLLRSDCVFVNGPALLEIKNAHGNAISVPMSADFELYSRSRLPETRVPSDLDSIPHPRIGYIGNINDKVDLGLICALAMARPDWSFILVGPSGVRSPEFKPDFERMKAMPNVHLLGYKKRELLPNYIKGLDVCTMFYRTDGWAYYVYPLKLHEYLASGKPVIGCDLPSLRDYDGTVFVAHTPEEWLQGIQEGLNDRDPARAAKRIQVAYENRLEERVAMIEEHLESKLKEKKLRAVSEINVPHKS